MFSCIADVFLKEITDKKSGTISKIVSFLNCMLVLILITSCFFPLENLFSKYLIRLDIELISNITLIIWYCSTFLFWVVITIFYISLFGWPLFSWIENKISKIKTLHISDFLHTCFRATHVSYSNIFDYLALSSLVLFCISPDRILFVFEETYKVENVFKIFLVIFVAICALECAFSMILYIFMKWIMPYYYQFKNICQNDK